MKEYRFRNNLKKSIKKIFIMGLVLAFVTGILKDKINVYANTTKVYNNDDIINTIQIDLLILPYILPQLLSFALS